ncbi:MAG: hypothetical protein Q9226_001359 [Calogaya cf. arnoldii]
MMLSNVNDQDLDPEKTQEIGTLDPSITENRARHRRTTTTESECLPELPDQAPFTPIGHGAECLPKSEFLIERRKVLKEQLREPCSYSTSLLPHLLFKQPQYRASQVDRLDPRYHPHQHQRTICNFGGIVWGASRLKPNGSQHIQNPPQQDHEASDMLLLVQLLPRQGLIEHRRVPRKTPYAGRDRIHSPDKRETWPYAWTSEFNGYHTNHLVVVYAEGWHISTLRAHKGTPLQSGNTKSQPNGSNGSSSQEEILGLKAIEAALYGIGMGMRDDDILKTTEVRVSIASHHAMRNNQDARSHSSAGLDPESQRGPSDPPRVRHLVNAPPNDAGRTAIHSFANKDCDATVKTGIKALEVQRAAFRQLKEQHDQRELAGGEQPNKGNKSSPKKRGATNTGEDNTSPKKKRAPAKSKTTAKASDGASETNSTDKKKPSTPGSCKRHFELDVPVEEMGHARCWVYQRERRCDRTWSKRRTRWSNRDCMQQGS